MSNVVFTKHDRQKAVGFIQQNPDLIPVITKLVKDEDKSRTPYAGKVPQNIVESVIHGSAADVRDINLIRRSLPELDTATLILVSAILFPNNMTQEDVTISYDGTLPGKLSEQLNNIIRERYFTDLKLQEELPQIIQNALMDRGSHILAILPESALDDVINQRTTASLENYRELTSGIVNLDTGHFTRRGVFGKGILNQQATEKRKVHSFESYFGQPVQQSELAIQDDIIPNLVRVVDNPDVLKAPQFFRAVSEARINQQFRTTKGTEFFDEGDALSTADLAVEDVNEQGGAIKKGYGTSTRDAKVLLADKFYKKPVRQFDKSTAVINDRTTSIRKSAGHPLILNLPHESTLPVFAPGNPKDHLGYLVLIDKLGHPITLSSIQQDMTNINDNFQRLSKSNTDSTFQTITTTLTNIDTAVNGPGMQRTDENNQMTLDILTNFYGEMLERDLMVRLNNGVFGDNVELTNQTEIYRIMLARSLAGQMTQILYIPASLVTYVAFNYNEFGIGESLIIKSRSLAALRISLMYANNRTLIRNAMGNHVIRITLDELDPNPDLTINTVLNDVIERNSQSRLFGSIDPTVIQTELLRGGWSTVVEGHPGYEQTQIDIENKQSDRPMVDSEYEENLRTLHLQALITVPELMETATNVNFAAEVTRDNVLFNSQNEKYRRTMEEKMLEFIQKATLHDGELIREMSEIIREHKDMIPSELMEIARDAKSTVPIIEEFLDQLVVNFPRANDKIEEISGAKVDSYSQMLDKTLEARFPDDIMETVFGDIEDDEFRSETIGKSRALIKSVLMAKWCRDNNVIPELDELIHAQKSDQLQLIDAILSANTDSIDAFTELFRHLRARYNPASLKSDDEDDSDGDSSFDSGSDDDTTTDIDNETDGDGGGEGTDETTTDADGETSGDGETDGDESTDGQSGDEEGDNFGGIELTAEEKQLLKDSGTDVDAL